MFPKYEISLSDFLMDLRYTIFSSQNKAADYVQVSRPTISRYENGTHQPPLGYLACLAQLHVAQHNEKADITLQQTALREVNRAIRGSYHDLPFKDWTELVAVAEEYLTQQAGKKTTEASPQIEPDETTSSTTRRPVDPERYKLLLLLKKVKSFWIEGVLAKSVHALVLLELGKVMDVEAIDHPWGREVQLLNHLNDHPQPLPPDKKISQIFEELNRAMLILGAPGSGKTITLLELARDLIALAEAEHSVAPIPVVLNLSSWTKGQPLIEWLLTELASKYQIPHRFGRRWAEAQQLLPLLDGFDEVQESYREACVEAINEFSQTFGLAGLVVCSRLNEYNALSIQLRLNGAIRLQPLTEKQIDIYLANMEPTLERLRAALHQDKPLQTLAHSPLMLNIMSLAYQNEATFTEQPLDTVVDTIEARRSHLFDRYIAHMLIRRGTVNQPYTAEQMINWLSWLARQMSKHNQTIFLIEQLQPSWLPTRFWQGVYLLGTRVLIGLSFGLLGMLINIMSTPELDTLVEILIVGISVALAAGISAGFMQAGLDFWRFNQSAKNQVCNRQAWPHKIGLTAWGNGFVVGGGVILFLNSVSIVTYQLGGAELIRYIFFILMDGLAFSLSSAVFFIIVIGIIFGVSEALLFLLRGQEQGFENDVQPTENLRWSWSSALSGGRNGALIGIIFGLILGSIGRLFLGSTGGLFFGVHLLPIVEVTATTTFALAGTVFIGLKSAVVEMKTKPNQGIRLSRQNAIFCGLLFFTIFGLFLGLNDVLQEGVLSGISFGLTLGIISGILGALWYGGFDVVQHYILRAILVYNGSMPSNYSRFLDSAADHIFLQQVGGGYIFIHRLLLEYFASVSPLQNELKEKVSEDKQIKREQNRSKRSPQWPS